MSRILIRVLWLTLISGLSLQGCTPPKPVRLGAPIEGFSHTSAAINRFSVNGGGGPNLAPYGYGGGQMCCASLPVKWHPGLTVVVEWEKDPNPYDSVNWPDPPFRMLGARRLKSTKRITPVIEPLCLLHGMRSWGLSMCTSYLATK
ncbi:DUF3304 domain-containing protein [Pseudomonas lundensis]|uniref:DUF3304 domain-containing protein n=1 Tax=Pseudomonas lundensis TaxID=86185 RepID=UPI0030B9BBD2